MSQGSTATTSLLLLSNFGYSLTANLSLHENTQSTNGIFKIYIFFNNSSNHIFVGTLKILKRREEWIVKLWLVTEYNQL